MGFLDDVWDSITDTASAGLKKALELAEPLVQAYKDKDARVVSGGGGYVYAQFPDGSIVISQGPGNIQDVKIINGSRAWKAITDEIGPWVSPIGDDEEIIILDDDADSLDGCSDAHELLGERVDQLDRAIDMMRDKASTGRHDQLVGEAIALYENYPTMANQLGQNDDELEDVVRDYVTRIKVVCELIYAADMDDERSTWEFSEADREGTLEAMLDVPQYDVWRSRYDKIEAAANAFLFSDANKAWDSFMPEFRDYYFDCAEGRIPIDEGTVAPKVPKEYETLNDGVAVGFDDEELEATRYGIELALHQARASYTGVPTGYQKAIKAVADAAHGMNMSYKQRILLCDKAWAKLRPVLSALPMDDRLALEDKIWALKKEWGAAMAADVAPQQDVHTDSGLAAIDLAKKAQTQMATTIKRLQVLEKAATPFASDFESAIRAAAGAQKKIPIETLEGATIFDPSTVTSVSKLTGVLSIVGGYIKYLEAQKKLGEEGHDAAERLAFEIDAYKTIADIAKSFGEISAAGVHLFAQMTNNTELAAKAAKFLDCKAIKGVGGALAVVDIVSSFCVLASSSSSDQDKLDAVVGATEGTLALSELAGAELAGSIGVSVTVTYEMSKWIAGEAQEFKYDMVGAFMRAAYQQLAYHAGSIRADGNRLVKLAKLMDRETDLAASAGMLDQWNEIAKSMGGTVRVILKLCGKTKRPDGLNELRDPGHCTKTLAPLFAPLVVKWGNIQSSEESVKAAGELLEAISEAFKNHEKYVQIESGTYSEQKSEPVFVDEGGEIEEDGPIDDGYGL